MTVKKNARTRSFSTKKNNNEPVVITIDDDSFTAKAAVPGAVILDFINAGTEGVAIAGQMIPFLEKAFPKSEFERLNKRLYATPDDEVEEGEEAVESIVDEELIGEIVSALIEEYTSRPSRESEQSSENS